VWAIGLMVLALVAAGGYAYVHSREACGAAVTSLPAGRSSSPFLDADQRATRPDKDRDALVDTLAGDPPPIGEVVGAVGYHYEQWAQVSAYAQGIGVRTRDNPDFTMLDDESLKPRWSVQVDAKRSTYDASAKRYLVATMPNDNAPDLVALDADNGKRVWCVSLDHVVHEADPFATQFLDDEDVAVLGPGQGSRERIVRLSGRDGELVWERTLDADSGDFLGDMGNGTLLVGGRPQFELFDPASVEKRPEGVALALLSARDGKTIWTRREPTGSDVHVLGTDPTTGTVVVQEWGARAGTALLRAINVKGNQEWFAVPARGDNFDATLRAGRILVRVGNHWSAYAIEDGHRLWRRTVPAKPQFLPYGFELDSIPMLDADHALVAGTSALHTLDLRTGAMTSAPLPTDGINTTYWPYEVAVSDRLIAVATNTGAVVFRRE
jgi:outer membrane protein assembly factor BamB